MFVFGVVGAGIPDVGADATSWATHKDDRVRFSIHDGHESTDKVEGHENHQKAQQNDSEADGEVGDESPIEVELA